MDFSYQMEKIGGRVEVCITKAHTFGTDSFLLSYFAAPRKKDVACDLGSGCGIIPLLWFKSGETAPQKAYCVDIQQQAVCQTAISVERSGLTGRLVPVQEDICRLKRLPGGEAMDLVTCNPPYKAANTGIPSTGESALIARHETLCSLDDVCACAARLLRFGGRLCMCQLPERLVDVLAFMRNNKVEPKRIRFVVQEAGMVPWLFLVEGKRGAKPFLTIEPPLILKEDGRASKEMEKIYQTYGKV